MKFKLIRWWLQVWSLRLKFRRDFPDYMKFRRDIPEYVKAHPLYGEAYFDHSKCVSVCYLVPFHFIMRLWHWFVFFWYRRIIRVDWWDTPFDLWKKEGKSLYETGFERGKTALRLELDVGMESIEDFKQFKIKAEQIRKKALQEGREQAYKEIEHNIEKYVEDNKENPMFKKQAE